MLNAIALHPQKLTYLEVIHKTNTGEIRPKSNAFYNAVLLSKDKYGKFKPIPDELIANRPFYTGTFGAIGDPGKKLGRYIEAECTFNGARKTIIAQFDKEHAALVDTIVGGDLIQTDGSKLITLFDAKTNKPITSNEEMAEADKLILKLNGKPHTFKIESRIGGVFEAVGDEKTFSWIFNTAVIGLFWRGGYYKLYDWRRDVGLVNLPSSCFCVAVDVPEGRAEKTGSYK